MPGKVHSYAFDDKRDHALYVVTREHRNARRFSIDVHKVASVNTPLQHFGAADEHAQAERQTRKRRGAKTEPTIAPHGSECGCQRGFHILANFGRVAGSE